jgi:hypothetical protein
MLAIRSAIATALTAAILGTAAFANPSTAHPVKSPPWISIESPVNPFDQHTRDAAFLVHAMAHDGIPRISDVTGSAEGMVGSTRRTIPLSFEPTDRPGVFAVRRQWPTEGAWLARISLFSATAIVTFDRAGNVASARVPTQLQSGLPIPRAVAAREIDSTLAEVARR